MIDGQAAKDIFSSYLSKKGEKHMKEYTDDIDIVFSPMSDETMLWLAEGAVAK